MLVGQLIPGLLLFSATVMADSVTYVYDSLQRLTRATYSSGTVINYTYDAGGNRTSHTTGNTSIPLPAISIDKTSLNFTANLGQLDPTPQTATVSNSGGGTLNWQANPADNWVKIAPSLGTNSGAITVSPSIAGLVAGTYSSTISLTAPGASNSPQAVSVKLVMTACGLTLSSTGFAPTALGASSSVALIGPAGCSGPVQSSAAWIIVTSGSTVSGGGTVSFTVAANSGGARTGSITIAGQTFPIVQGGASTVTTSKVGAYNAGYWVQDLNGNFTWDGTSVDRLTYWSLGRAGEIPVSGDWNGDGRTKIGLYVDGTWLLDYNGNGVWDGPNVDKLVYFGGPGYTPYVGDWNGSGTSKIAVHQNGTWLIDFNGNFAWDGPATDKLIFFGGPGYAPVLGDWNGSGTTKIGVHQNGTWLLDYNGNFAWDGPGTDKLIFFGGPGYTPVVGDWNGSGNTKVGAHLNGLWILDYNGNFVWDGTGTDKLIFFGGTGYTPMVGDWNGSGSGKVGAYLNGLWVLDVNGNLIWDPPTDQVIFFGGPGQTPIVGKW